MDLDKVLKVIEEEAINFRKKLYERGVPVTDIEFDQDDIWMCEPFGHLHLELDEGWFYNQIENKEKE